MSMVPGPPGCLCIYIYIIIYNYIIDYRWVCLNMGPGYI